jgi:hypothetical protein
VGIPVNREFIEYKWLGKGHGLPLLQVTDNLLGFVVEYVDSVRTVSTGAEREVPLTPFDLMIYPNPAQKYIHISSSGIHATTLKVSLFDMSGQRVFSGETKGGSALTVDLEKLKLEAGQYVIRAQGDEGMLTRKFIFTP